VEEEAEVRIQHIQSPFLEGQAYRKAFMGEVGEGSNGGS